MDAPQEALDHYGARVIFNTDQGAQFTSNQFTDVLCQHGVRTSMDGRGRFFDSIFIERLWRLFKCECVYLKEFADARELARAIKGWIRSYNTERPFGLARLRMAALGACAAYGIAYGFDPPPAGSRVDTASDE